MISFSTSSNFFCWFECHGQHNARGSDKSFLPSLEGSCFETSFGLAGFTETPEVYFVEEEVHLAGDVIAAARKSFCSAEYVCNTLFRPTGHRTEIQVQLTFHLIAW